MKINILGDKAVLFKIRPAEIREKYSITEEEFGSNSLKTTSVLVKFQRLAASILHIAIEKLTEIGISWDENYCVYEILVTTTEENKNMLKNHGMLPNFMKNEENVEKTECQIDENDNICKTFIFEYQYIYELINSCSNIKNTNIESVVFKKNDKYYLCMALNDKQIFIFNYFREHCQKVYRTNKTLKEICKFEKDIYILGQAINILSRL